MLARVLDGAIPWYHTIGVDWKYFSSFLGYIDTTPGGSNMINTIGSTV